MTSTLGWIVAAGIVAGLAWLLWSRPTGATELGTPLLASATPAPAPRAAAPPTTTPSAYSFDDEEEDDIPTTLWRPSDDDLEALMGELDEK